MSGYPIDDDDDVGGRPSSSRESSSTRSRGYPEGDRDYKSPPSRGGGGGGRGRGATAGSVEKKTHAPARSDDEDEPVPPPVIKNPRKQTSVPPDDKEQVVTFRTVVVLESGLAPPGLNCIHYSIVASYQLMHFWDRLVKTET